MSEAGERQRAKAKEDVLASRAKPRPEGRVCERGWRPTGGPAEFRNNVTEAARRRAIEAADTRASNVHRPAWRPQMNAIGIAWTR